MMTDKILVAPDGTMLRAAHIVSVSPPFELSIGTELVDAFAVHVVGNDEPFQFWAPGKFKSREKQKVATEKAYAEFVQAADRHQLNAVTRDEVSHCILAHHGFLEWGSPVEPAAAPLVLVALHT